MKLSTNTLPITILRAWGRRATDSDILIYDFFYLTLHSSDESFDFCNELKKEVCLNCFCPYWETDFTSRQWTFIGRPLALLFVLRITLQGSSLTSVCCDVIVSARLLLRRAWIYRNSGHPCGRRQADSHGEPHYELMRIEKFRQINTRPPEWLWRLSTRLPDVERLTLI